MLNKVSLSHSDSVEKFQDKPCKKNYVIDFPETVLFNTCLDYNATEFIMFGLEPMLLIGNIMTDDAGPFISS